MSKLERKIPSIIKKCILEYLPVLPQRPEYPICKRFLEDFQKLLKDLEIDHAFAHSDEPIYDRQGSQHSGKTSKIKRKI